MKYLLLATILAVAVLSACKSTAAPSIVGKWHTTVEDPDGKYSVDLKFLASGDFEKTDDKGSSSAESITETSAGRYTFVDAKHLKLDYGMRSEIYEVILLSDVEMRLKDGEGMTVWRRVK